MEDNSPDALGVRDTAETPPKVAWGAVFVCQGGALERKAAVLAASLRQQNGFEPRLVAAIPGPESVWPRPSNRTLAYLETLGVEVEKITNPIGPHYPIGNKLGCLAVMPRDVHRCFILDSDLLALAPIHGSDLPAEVVAAKPEDRPGPWIDRKMWRQLYRRVEVPVWDRADEVTTTISGHRMPPYFNAGVVAMDPRSGFGERWLELARRIDPASEIPARHPWLDQIALPLAARSLGTTPAKLDMSWNYPAHHWLVRGSVRIAHYHAVAAIEADPALLSAVQQLAHEDPDLGDLLAEDQEWARVLGRAAALPRSQLVLLAGPPDQNVTAALERFRQLGYETVRMDPAFITRVQRNPDVTWAGAWLRRHWFEIADGEPTPVVLWDDTSLHQRVDALFKAVDGYRVALWDRADEDGSTGGAPRLRPLDVQDAASLGEWLNASEPASASGPRSGQPPTTGRAARRDRRRSTGGLARSMARTVLPRSVRAALRRAAGH